MTSASSGDLPRAQVYLPEQWPEARLAATVLVLRDGPDGRLEVFMVRRHNKSAFMPDAYVYPGGVLDAQDTGPTALEHVTGMTPAQAAASLLGRVDHATAVGLYLAAVRETFEEAGLLLATAPAQPHTFVNLGEDEAVAARFARWREQLWEGEASLSDMADAEELLVPLDQLTFAAHWITPLVEPRRYDTYFFYARAPAHQRPLHDDRETTDGLWLAPQEALARSGGGGDGKNGLKIAPPTLATLEQLSRFEAVDEAMAWAQAHEPPALLPHPAQIGDELWLLMPGDPDYPGEHPALAQATPAGDGSPTRVKFEM